MSMSLLQVKESVGTVACAIIGHDIRQEDEKRLYEISPVDGKQEISDAKCGRCGSKLHFRVDPNDKDSYFVTEE